MFCSSPDELSTNLEVEIPGHDMGTGRCSTYATEIPAATGLAGKGKHVRLDEPPQDERPRCFDCICSVDMIQLSNPDLFHVRMFSATNLVS